jgi:hypothetical protein
MLAAFGLFLAWALLLLSFVRHYGGGTWSGDWIEQYQRTIFFLHRRPLDTLMIGTFPLPARPPMMNLIAASFLAQIAPQYDVFQLVYLFLNALVFLPACLIARDLVARPGRRVDWVVLLVLAASPMVAQNATYAWTKLFTAFYILLGTHLYLRGWRKGLRSYMVFAFGSLCAGFLVHHSAGPYALLLGLHYVTVVFWRRRGKWTEAATIGVVSLVILLTWFGWSIHTYGKRTTFTSQSTITDAPPTFAANVANIGRNLGNTILPTVLRNPGIMHIEELEQQNTAGRVRDFTFLIYQVSLTFGLGSVGAALIVYLLYLLLRRCDDSFPALSRAVIERRERFFWLAYFLVVFLVGVAVYGGTTDRFGVAHICLQGLVLIGLSFLAAGFRYLGPVVRWLLIAGLALDFSLGVLLQLSLENLDQTVEDPNTHELVAFSLAQAPKQNLGAKLAPLEWFQRNAGNHKPDGDPLLQTPFPFWGDNFGGLLPGLQIILIALFLCFIWLAMKPPARGLALTDSAGGREAARAVPKRQRVKR